MTGDRGDDVVVALIESKTNPEHFLVQYRDFNPIDNPDKNYHGMLEFPGGKIDHSIDGTHDLCDVIALCREVKEEVGITVNKINKFLCSIDYKFPNGVWHNVHFFVVTDYDGEPEGKEGQRIGWVTLYQLITYPKCLPLNRAAALILTTERHPDILE